MFASDSHDYKPKVLYYAYEEGTFKFQKSVDVPYSTQLPMISYNKELEELDVMGDFKTTTVSDPRQYRH